MFEMSPNSVLAFEMSIFYFALISFFFAEASACSGSLPQYQGWYLATPIPAQLSYYAAPIRKIPGTPAEESTTEVISYGPGCSDAADYVPPQFMPYPYEIIQVARFMPVPEQCSDNVQIEEVDYVVYGPETGNLVQEPDEAEKDVEEEGEAEEEEPLPAEPVREPEEDEDEDDEGEEEEETVDPLPQNIMQTAYYTYMPPAELETVSEDVEEYYQNEEPSVEILTTESAAAAAAAAAAACDEEVETSSEQPQFQSQEVSKEPEQPKLPEEPKEPEQPNPQEISEQPKPQEIPEQPKPQEIPEQPKPQEIPEQPEQPQLEEVAEEPEQPQLQEIPKEPELPQLEEVPEEPQQSQLQEIAEEPEPDEEPLVTSAAAVSMNQQALIHDYMAQFQEETGDSEASAPCEDYVQKSSMALLRKYMGNGSARRGVIPDKPPKALVPLVKNLLEDLLGLIYRPQNGKEGQEDAEEQDQDQEADEAQEEEEEKDDDDDGDEESSSVQTVNPPPEPNTKNRKYPGGYLKRSKFSPQLPVVSEVSSVLGGLGLGR